MIILYKYILKPYIWALLASFFALFFSYLLEYQFSLDPCHLCIMQRYTYFITIILCLLALIYKYKNIISLLICFSIYCTLGIAIWHLGIELHWWTQSSSCANWDSNIGSLNEELQNNLLETTSASCDLTSPKFLNITLVQWSFIYIIVNSIFVTILTYKQYVNRQK